MRRKLRANEDSTSTQIAIVIISTLNDYPASDFAVEVGQGNKIGQGKKNNGAIILLAKNDHKGFIATGYGLEPTLTDATCDYIFQNILRPALKEGDYYGGLDKATDAIIKATAGEFKTEPTNARSRQLLVRRRSHGYCRDLFCHSYTCSWANRIRYSPDCHRIRRRNVQDAGEESCKDYSGHQFSAIAAAVVSEAEWWRIFRAEVAGQAEGVLFGGGGAGGELVSS